MTLYLRDKDPEFIEYPLNNYIGYEYEALEVMDCIRDGKLESEIMPLDELMQRRLPLFHTRGFCKIAKREGRGHTVIASHLRHGDTVCACAHAHQGVMARPSFK